MPFETTITPWHVAVALGQPKPVGFKNDQWEQAITDAVMFINDRAENLNVTEINQVKLDFVVREVVADQIRRRAPLDDPEFDGRQFKTVADWWPLLGLDGGTGEAFQIDLMGANSGPQAWKYLTPDSEIVL